MMIAAIVVAILLALAGAILVLIGWSGLRDGSDGAVGLKASFFLGLALLVIAAAIGLTITMRPAHAAPPEGADPALAPWFGSLSLNGGELLLAQRLPSRGRCVSGPTAGRPMSSPASFHWRRTDIWVEVPAEKIVRGKSHPHGLATMCWAPTRGGDVLHGTAGSLTWISKS